MGEFNLANLRLDGGDEEKVDFIVRTYNKSLKLLSMTFENKLTDNRISFDMFMILHFIDRAGEKRITLSEIADKQEVTKSAISRKVGTLLDLGYINQVNDSQDRRKKYLILTKKGQKVYDKNRLIFEKMLNDVADQYGSEDFTLTLQHINQIVDIIKSTMN
ncbi:hypothetical protein IV79_GL000638 [Pediococcus claussenii]|nr:hypothetical protein IV79_GL000638 [Pediococcus claussenii]